MVGLFAEGQTLTIDSLRYHRMTMKKRGDETFGTIDGKPPAFRSWEIATQIEYAWNQ